MIFSKLLKKIGKKHHRAQQIPVYELNMLSPEEEADRFKDHIVTDPDELREIAIWMLPDLEKFGKDYQRYWLKTFGEKHGISLDDLLEI